MRFSVSVLLVALISGSLAPAMAQSRFAVPADPALEKQIRDSIEQARADGNLSRVQRELGKLLELYPNEPEVRAPIYLAMAEAFTGLGDDAKSHQYRAMALAIDPHLAERHGVQAAGAENRGQKADQVLSYLSMGLQFATQIQQARAQRAAAVQQPMQQPMMQAAPQNAFPQAPVGMPGAPLSQMQQPAPGGFSGSPNMVLVGYDANNQPIYAAAQPGSQPQQVQPGSGMYPAPPASSGDPTQQMGQMQNQPGYNPVNQSGYPAPPQGQPQAYPQQPNQQQPPYQQQPAYPAQQQYPPQQPQSAYPQQPQYPQQQPQSAYPAQQQYPQQQPQSAYPAQQQYPQQQSQSAYPQQRQYPQQQPQSAYPAQQQYPQQQPQSPYPAQSLYPQQQPQSAYSAQPQYPPPQPFDPGAMRAPSNPYAPPANYGRRSARGDQAPPIKVFYDRSHAGDSAYFNDPCPALIAVDEQGALTVTSGCGEAAMVIPSSEIVNLRMNVAVGKQIGAFHIETARGLYLMCTGDSGTPDKSLEILHSLTLQLKMNE